MTWARQNHISNITVKANRTISFLRRNIHACPKEVKAAAYTTSETIHLICKCCMGPIQQKPDILNRLCTAKSCMICIEQLSRQRTRSSNISNLKLESLEQRCAKAKTVLMNEIIHNLVYNLQNIYLYHLIVELEGLQPSALYIHKDLYSMKDMNLGRFNIDCMQVCCVARLPIVQFVHDARALINRVELFIASTV